MTKLNLKDIKTGNVQTDHGWDVRILATDLKGEYPVCYTATNKDNTEQVLLRATAEGKCSTFGRCETGYDLILIPQPQYFNIYTPADDKKYLGSMSSSVVEAEEKARRRNGAGIHRIHQTYKYLNGEITKVDPEEDE